MLLFGENDRKQLGLEGIEKLNDLKNNLFEKKVLNYKNFKMIKNGWYHNLLIFNENGKDKLYGFGCNNKGQIGEFNVGKNSSDLVEIKFFNDKKIKDIECGAFHNLILLGYYLLFIKYLIFNIYYYYFLFYYLLLFIFIIYNYLF